MPRPIPRNLQELADRLELSIATVSLVLSGRSRALRIAPRTETRIRQAAERYGIQPNRIAASLRSGRTASIGLVVPDIANPFFAALAQHLERSLRHRGQAVLLADSEESVEVEERSLHELRQRRVDGLIVAPVEGRSALLSQWAGEGFPLVCLDRVAPELGVPKVSTDHAAAARLAVQTLLDHGHRRIGCLRGTSGVSSDDDRVRGYQAALRAAGIKPKAAWIDGGDFTRETARAAAGRLLAQGELTAIVPLAGQSTLGLLEALGAARLRCPDDISIVAFDEQPWSAFVAPPLTTIEQPVAELAQAAADFLQRRLEGQEVPAALRLTSRLVTRCSVAPPARSRI